MLAPVRVCGAVAAAAVPAAAAAAAHLLLLQLAPELVLGLALGLVTGVC